MRDKWNSEHAFYLIYTPSYALAADKPQHPCPANTRSRLIALATLKKMLRGRLEGFERGCILHRMGGSAEPLPKRRPHSSGAAAVCFPSIPSNAASAQSSCAVHFRPALCTLCAQLKVTEAHYFIIVEGLGLGSVQSRSASQCLQLHPIEVCKKSLSMSF